MGAGLAVREMVNRPLASRCKPRERQARRWRKQAMNGFAPVGKNHGSVAVELVGAEFFSRRFIANKL